MFDIILNLKAYHESTLGQAQRLCRILDTFLSTHSQTDYSFFLAPNLIDLQTLHTNFPRVPMIAPHVDPLKEGKQTGWIPAAIVKNVGISTTILNHTEHRMALEELPDMIQRLKEVGIETIVCCQTIEEARELIEAAPYAVAFELPALIGSGKSITHEEALVTEYISLKKPQTRMYVGAGISTGDDIEAAQNLGIEGVLLATAFVFAKDPLHFLQTIVLSKK